MHHAGQTQQLGPISTVHCSSSRVLLAGVNHIRYQSYLLKAVITFYLLTLISHADGTERHYSAGLSVSLRVFLHRVNSDWSFRH